MVLWERTSQISTTWSHNCCGFRGRLLPYHKILPSFSLAHICSITFDLGAQGIILISGLLANHLWTSKLQCTGWLSCWKIKFPSEFQTYTEGSITFSKIFTYCGALNRPWIRSSTQTAARDIQPQHDTLNRHDLSRRWIWRVSYLVPGSRLMYPRDLQSEEMEVSSVKIMLPNGNSSNRLRRPSGRRLVALLSLLWTKLSGNEYLHLSNGS